MKRVLTIAACIAICLAGCSFPNTPTMESIPISLDTPIVTSTPKTSITATPVPVVAVPESETGFVGEWAGYLGGDQVDFALDWTWAAKLNIRSRDAWLSLDRIDHVKDTWDLPFIKPVTENVGARLEIISRDEESIVLSVKEFAYHTGDEPPFPVGTRLTLSYIAVTNEQERSLLTVSKFLVPPYIGSDSPGDMLEGAVLAVGGDQQCAAAFTRLLMSDTDNPVYPRWDKELNNLSQGVRGVYSFGERGADNDNSSYIFVYTDEQGYEHIRMTFCWIVGAARQGTSTAFVTTQPVFDFGLSMAGVPYWDTLYELDAATGGFIDVSVKYTDYYRDVYIPRINWFLSGGRPDESADREARLSYEAQEEMLRRALTITEGERPKELPPIPTIEPNAPILTGELPSESATPEPIQTPDDAIKRLNLTDHFTFCAMTHGDFLGDDAQDTAVLYSYIFDITHFALTVIDGGSGGVIHTEIVTDFIHGPYVRTAKGPDNKDVLLVSFDSGGSGGDMLHIIYDVTHGQFIDMFHQGNRELHPVGTLLDDFNASVYIESTNETFIFSVEGNRDAYSDTEDGAGYYTSDGKLRAPEYHIFFDGLASMKSEEIDGRQAFIGVQYGSGRGHQDTVCAVYSQYGYDADGDIILEKVWLESLVGME